MIECNDLGFTVEGRTVLKGVSFTVEEGEILGLIGPSGSGKSILLKLLAGSILNHEGTISYNGIPLKEYQKEKKHVKISYSNTALPENIDDSVINFLHLARIPHKKFFKNFSDYDTQIVENWLDQFGLTAGKDSALRTLSDSALRRSVLANAFIYEALVMILDDPSAYLDIESIARLYRAVRRYVINGERMVVLGGNDINLALQVSDRIILLNGSGSIAAHCSPESVTGKMLGDIFNTEVLLSRNIYNGRPEIHIFPE